jgi:hypothetical protein
MVELTLGSDHAVYNDSSFGIPAIYYNDWPDRFIHTDRDVPANLDPTKLGRVAFLAAASGWVLANATAEDADELWAIQRSAALRRTATLLERRRSLVGAEKENLTRFHLAYERALVDSMARFLEIPQAIRLDAERFLTQRATLLGAPSSEPRRGGAVYRRNPAHRGTATAFGYSWIADHIGAETTSALGLLAHRGLRGGGGDYAYEALNLVDGRRTTVEIRDALAAIYGPVPLAKVEEYLAALEAVQLIGR